MHSLRLLWAAHNEDVFRKRRERNVSRLNILKQINGMLDDSFREIFGLDKATFRDLCQELDTHTVLRGTKEIPLELKVLCTLSFLATGSYQRIFGVTQQLPQRSASRCIRQVVDAISSNFMLRRYIKFPQTLQERSRVRQENQRRFNLPGVIGCLDCTHVSIIKPDKDEKLYFNRKGYHSLKVQMICDQSLKILNVNADYGGATHDSLIWASNEVEPHMRELHQQGEQTWLLGDSEYPQRAWLMTPILDAAPGSQEDLYTSLHMTARKCIEQCFCLLKARWKCLLKQKMLHYHPHVASQIVTACCILHNIALEAGLPLPVNVEAGLDDDDDEENVHENVDDELADSDPTSEQDLMHGRETRNCIISLL